MEINTLYYLDADGRTCYTEKKAELRLRFQRLSTYLDVDTSRCTHLT
jgi:hypothetical protein